FFTPAATFFMPLTIRSPTFFTGRFFFTVFFFAMARGLLSASCSPKSRLSKGRAGSALDKRLKGLNERAGAPARQVHPTFLLAGARVMLCAEAIRVIRPSRRRDVRISGPPVRYFRFSAALALRPMDCRAWLVARAVGRRDLRRLHGDPLRAGVFRVAAARRSL